MREFAVFQHAPFGVQAVTVELEDRVVHVRRLGAGSEVFSGADAIKMQSAVFAAAGFEDRVVGATTVMGQHQVPFACVVHGDHLMLLPREHGFDQRRTAGGRANYRHHLVGWLPVFIDCDPSAYESLQRIQSDLFIVSGARVKHGGQAGKCGQAESKYVASSHGSGVVEGDVGANGVDRLGTKKRPTAL